MDLERLKTELMRDEGFVSHAYQDSLGYWTIGIGRLIDERRGGGISESEARFLLGNDMREVLHELDHNFDWWRDMTDNRQRALANMAFNLGMPTLLKFRNTLKYMQAGDWKRVHDNALKSKWARQVGERAERIADLFLHG